MYTILIIISLQLLPDGVVIKTTEEIGPMLEKECLTMQFEINQLASTKGGGKELLSVACLTKGKI